MYREIQVLNVLHVRNKHMVNSIYYDIFGNNFFIVAQHRCTTQWEHGSHSCNKLHIYSYWKYILANGSNSFNKLHIYSCWKYILANIFQHRQEEQNLEWNSLVLGVWRVLVRVSVSKLMSKSHFSTIIKYFQLIFFTCL